MSFSGPVNVFIKTFNPLVLWTILGNQINKLGQFDVLVESQDLISPTKRLINRLHLLNQYNLLIINPLHPLTDNLDLQVYQAFHLDSNKYQRYDNAIELAIQDLKQKYTRPLNILIIGPGMGDLIDMVLKYYPFATAIEKNPKVSDHLMANNKTKWDNKVRLIFDDVRNISDCISNKYDLVISEMLGSFGCNELFPEILQNIEAEIMIPSSVTACLAPINCPLITPDVKQPFLNNLTNYYQLCEVQELWEWDYQSSNLNLNNRTSSLIMTTEVSGTINALMGVFYANLYGNYTITNEKIYNEQLYCKSWFPMVFPITEINVSEGQEVTIEFSRVSNLKVSYVWSVNGVRYNEGGEFSMELV